jgi:hypothetical protein
MAAEAPVAAPPVQHTEEAQVVAAPAKDAKEPKKPKKPKKGEAAAGAAAGAGDGPNVAAHPRAARSIALVKGWGGLVGFLLGGYLSLPTSTVAAAGLRALVAGIVCYVACWGAAVFVWRRLVMLEIKGREQKLVAEVRAAQAARASGRAPGAGPGGIGAQDAP